MKTFNVTPELQEKIDKIIEWFGHSDINLNTNKIITRAIEKYYLRKLQKIDVTQKVQMHRGLLYRRQGGKCGYCKEILSRKKMTVDHVQPLSRGGENILENMLACCERCNVEKSDMTKTEYEFFKLSTKT